MAINTDQITTDITLEIDEDIILIADFKKAMDSFISLVKEITKTVMPEHHSDVWTVKVYEGSAGLGVSGDYRNYRPDQIDVIRNALFDSLNEISAGVRPSLMSDKAIGHSVKIAKCFNELHPVTRLWNKKESAFELDSTFAGKAAKLIEPAYEEFGTIDGFLQEVKSHGADKCVIYDVLNDRAITCEVSKSILAEALTVFDQRVEVAGNIKYRADGMPVSVKAFRLVAFPKASEIPSLEEIRRILN